jgi:hypothetical protein
MVERAILTVQTEPIAEVIASSITGFTAELSSQIVPESKKPNFGSFIICRSETNNIDTVGVVHNVITGSVDKVHRAAALGLSREQLKIQQPQIFSLLRTEIHATTIGYLQNRKAFQYLPPQPPDVHDFVYAASEEEIIAVTTDFGFLRLLLDVSDIPSDELIAALIRQAYLVHSPVHDRDGEDGKQFLVLAGHALSQLFRNDYDRLVSILKKIRPRI